MQGMRGGLPPGIAVALRSAAMRKHGRIGGDRDKLQRRKLPHQLKQWAPWDSNPQPAD